MAKKHYTRPTITELGNAVEQTKGVWGGVWENTGETFTTGDPVLPPPGGGDDGGDDDGHN
jgi:hypothetical protein